jgi:hypothetical protein
MTSIAAKLEELPTPMLIALVLIGLMIWWPLALAVVAYLIWSRRMMCCGFGISRWDNSASGVRQDQDRRARPRPSGNQAFDDYRAETLRRLEKEEQAFRDFLARLRVAKDKAEFDQFMAERSNRVPAEPKAQS